MKKTLLEELKDARLSREPKYVSFFNDKTISVDNYGEKRRMEDYYLDSTIRDINITFRTSTEILALDNEFDAVSLDLKLGLVFDIEDVTDNKEIKAGSKPINGIVRCYTGCIKGYVDGKKSNDKDNSYYETQGYVNYDDLVSTMENNGVSFNGPKSFEEFENAIYSFKKFDISLNADLKNEKEELKVTEKEKAKKLVKKPFFWQR